MVVFWGLAFLFLRRFLRYSEFVEDRRTGLLNTPFLLDLVVVVAYRVIVYNYAFEPWLPGALFLLYPSSVEYDSFEPVNPSI